MSFQCVRHLRSPVAALISCIDVNTIVVPITGASDIMIFYITRASMGCAVPGQLAAPVAYLHWDIPYKRLVYDTHSI